jgi:pimeloyl-ACP methyl ester carboxylesterase
MPHFFVAPDGTTLAYHLTDPLAAHGGPLVCVPGGPMMDSAYLGDLGGLAADRQLLRLDLRGTGDSETPADPASYRCDRQVADLEALRVHLGLGRLALLGHSAGANLVYRYAETHPDRVSRLVLVTPSPRGVGVDREDDERATLAASRSAEPWYADAAAAFDRVRSGAATEDDWAAIDPFTFGRWDEDVRAYHASMSALRHDDAASVFAEGYDPEVTVPALARLDVPVVVLAGEVDLGNPPGLMADLAATFPAATFVVQPAAGHYPWVDDPAVFRALLHPHLT